MTPVGEIPSPCLDFILAETLSSIAGCDGILSLDGF